MSEPIIKEVIKQTNNKFLNMYKMIYKKDDKEHEYFISSRRESVEELACMSKDKTIKADAVMIIPITENDELLFIRQYRYPIGQCIYEFPAGLIDKSDPSNFSAAKRELHEETGLDVLDMTEFISPRYLSVGMTDEALGIYIAKVTGELTNKYQDENEDISYLLVKIEDVKDFILKNNVAMQAALIGMAIALAKDVLKISKQK